MKMTIVPPPLKVGSRIGIVSPSAPITPNLLLQLQEGISFLEGHGHEVIKGSFVFEGSGKQRAEDLHRFFSDPSIGAIIATQGGNTSEDVLDHLDFALIEAHPKIFMGFSDISVLLNAISHYTGLVTYHGPDVAWGLSVNRQIFTERIIPAALRDTTHLEIHSHAEHQWWKQGKGEGCLSGGNLRCFLKLKETPVITQRGGSTLFFWEDVHGNAKKAREYLSELIQRDYFYSVQGMVVGYLHDYGPIEEIEEMLLNLFSDFRFPILYAPDFGHKCENTIIPIGRTAMMDSNRDPFNKNDILLVNNRR